MKSVYLPPESQKKLIELSRHALEDFVRRTERQRENIDDLYLQRREYGAFVSLHNKEELRGCIGNCAPKEPLSETVTEITKAAASRDYRVKPVSKKELAEIRIDITVLSPIEAVDDPLQRRHVLLDYRLAERVVETVDDDHAVRVAPQIARPRVIEEVRVAELRERRRHDEDRLRRTARFARAPFAVPRFALCARFARRLRAMASAPSVSTPMIRTSGRIERSALATPVM